MGHRGPTGGVLGTEDTSVLFQREELAIVAIIIIYQAPTMHQPLAITIFQVLTSSLQEAVTCTLHMRKLKLRDRE
jgi:hypothetical protein